MSPKYVQVMLAAALIFVVVYASASEVDISQLGFVGGSIKSVPNGYQVKTKLVIERSADKEICVSGIELKFNREVAAGSSIYINLLEKNGGVIAYADYTTSTQNKEYTIPLTPTNATSKINPQNVASITVTLTEP